MMKRESGWVLWVLFFLLLLVIVEGGIWREAIEGKSLFKEMVKGVGKKRAGVSGLGKKGGKYRDHYPLYWDDNIKCEPREDNGRYLLMSKRNGGWNNERIIIETSFIMAWLLNRTLVIPVELKYDHMHGRENFDKFLDMRVARCFAPIVTSDILPSVSEGKINEKFEGAEEYSDCHTFHDEYMRKMWAIPHEPDAAEKKDTDFEAFRIGRQVVNFAPSWMEGVKSRNTNFPNTARILNSKKHAFSLYYLFYWFADKSYNDLMIDIIKNGMHYHEKYFDLAYKVLEELGEPGTFSTIHVRSRDFRRQGGYYSHMKHKSWFDAYRANHADTLRKGEKLYIAIDEKNLTDIRGFQTDLKKHLGIESYTIYDFLEKFEVDASVRDRRWEFWGNRKLEQEEVTKFSLNNFGAVEQIICAHGRRFIGTYFSTYTAHIVRLRGYLPFEAIQDDEHLFWDRQLTTKGCAQQSSPEWCSPSWNGGFRSALWASEYEEGWLHYDEVKERKNKRRALLEANGDPSSMELEFGNSRAQRRRSRQKMLDERKERLLQEEKEEDELAAEKKRQRKEERLRATQKSEEKAPEGNEKPNVSTTLSREEFLLALKNKVRQK